VTKTQSAGPISCLDKQISIIIVIAVLLILSKYSSTSITRGNGQKLYKEHCLVDVTKDYFSNRVVDVWNCLPSCVVSAPSLNSFKHNIKSVDK